MWGGVSVCVCARACVITGVGRGAHQAGDGVYVAARCDPP